MADLNALIAQGAQFQAPPDPFAQYGRMQQLQNAGMQNQLTQQKLASAKLTYDQAKGAQDFISGVMQKAQENGSDVTDPFYAAKQMLNHPNPAVQAVGTHLLDAHQKVRAFEQQQAWDAANAPGPGATGSATTVPAAAPTAAYTPTSLMGTLGGPTPVAAGALGSGTFDVNALVTKALTPAPAPVVNALNKQNAPTAESLYAQIKQGDIRFGASPGWQSDRNLLVEQYKALLQPRHATFASINPGEYTPDSIATFNATGNYSDLVPRAPKGEKSGISNITVSDFTPASVAKFSKSNDYSDLVPKEVKETKVIGNVTVSDFTPASVAKFAKSQNYADLVLAPKATSAGQGKPPTGYRYDSSGENLEVIPGGPADKQEKLKPIPPQINTAIITNQQSIKKLDDALKLLKDNPDAVGLKGGLPQYIVNRTDEKGIPVRAAIADIGSLVLHDRSGAAVTASEEPRLLPFIPTPSDTAKSAKEKLERMRKYAIEQQDALKGTYSEDQGYRTNPILNPSNPPAPAGASVINAADAILARTNQGRR